MRTVAWLLLAACGGAPVLANAPHPDPGAVAGVAAAAAAAATLVDPDAATRKPEKRVEAEKQPVTVKENVPPDVFDRLDHPPAAGSDAPTESVKATRPRKGPPPKLPSPRDITDPSAHD